MESLTRGCAVQLMVGVRRAYDLLRNVSKVAKRGVRFGHERSHQDIMNIFNYVMDDEIDQSALRTYMTALLIIIMAQLKVLEYREPRHIM